LQAWTVKRLLEWGIEYFNRKQVPQARLSAELLLSSALKLSRMKLYLNYDYRPTEKELAQFKRLILKRLEHMPIQYILGLAGFRKMELKVGPEVLIPRPETEVLVDQALEIIAGRGPRLLNIIDIGTGSGAIALSLAAEIPKDIPFHILATDCSSQAIEIARANARALLGPESLAKIEIMAADAIPQEKQFVDKYKQDINMVISNPPYVSEQNYQNLDREIRDYEPRQALVGGPTGSEAYAEIFEKVKPFLAPGDCFLLLEVDPLVSEKAAELCQQAINPVSIEIKKDYNQKDRVLIARMQPREEK